MNDFQKYQIKCCYPSVKRIYFIQFNHIQSSLNKIWRDFTSLYIDKESSLQMYSVFVFILLLCCCCCCNKLQVFIKLYSMNVSTLNSFGLITTSLRIMLYFQHSKIPKINYFPTWLSKRVKEVKSFMTCFYDGFLEHFAQIKMAF